MRVKATREGLVGQRTSSGYLVDVHVPFVALPSYAALFKVVRVVNPLNKQEVVAIVLDVGPWNIHDDDYVFKGSRPAAEHGADAFNRQTNGAGIDLGERVWKVLGMLDNSDVDWEFVA